LDLLSHSEDIKKTFHDFWRKQQVEGIAAYKLMPCIDSRAGFYLATLDIKGRKEGERDKAREIARSMRQGGADTALIAKWTGLAIEEIEKLE
jgi:hypothetical protein